METFRINRNSWHYRLNCRLIPLGDDRFYMEEIWEPKHSNFCAYWRTTVLKLIWVAIASFFIGTIFFMIGSVLFVHPIETLKVIGVIIGVIALFVAPAVVSTGFTTLNKKVKNSDSLFIQKYRAHKSKICPKVEFK